LNASEKVGNGWTVSMKSSTSEWRGEVTADGPTDAIDTQWPLEASLTQLETDEILCVAHDISARQAHQRRFTGLAAASRELLAAEDCGWSARHPKTSTSPRSGRRSLTATVRLVSKQHGRQERSIGSIGDELEDRLTDKQLAVLEESAAGSIPMCLGMGVSDVSRAGIQGVTR